MTPSSAVIRSARAREVVAAGRRLLEEEGPEALTMRRLAERLGIRAPSLYKHLPDKAALEAAIIATGFEEAAAAFEAAVEGAAEGGGQGAHGGAGGTASDGAGTGAGRALPALAAGGTLPVLGAGGTLPALAAAYRRFALAHPHLYRLMTNGPLPREHLPPGLEDRTAAPVLRAAGSRARARAVWAFAHGMVMLELDHRFPADADLDAAWRAGIAAFQPG
ncbi:MAG TPA: TetR/AcrR family transcriptional regulator [Actinomycetota bacterium]|nr:TetR/AcrR family transcriptional regulator [Actinomycetota bacterium]